MVRRVPHPDDARTTLAAITRSGRDLVGRATLSLNAEVFEQTGLDDAQQEQLVDVIAALRVSAGDFDA
jgi:DNA-binding MarR family transcriptional regulator